MNTAEIYLWGTRIGIVHLSEDIGISFEYDRKFLSSGIELSPLMMPLSDAVYHFRTLNGTSFRGMPGLIADSLPDRFGNVIISQWLAEQGRSEQSFNAIDRLSYTGKRGMGALEYVPATGPVSTPSEKIDVDEMIRFASEILSNREKRHLNMNDNLSARQLLLLGTSAGGARAKAVIAWNKDTGDIRSGQIKAGDGYEYWIIKFDNVKANGDHGVEDVPKYTLIEYAYYLMAQKAGIEINECRLLHENGRNHFMTKRFDRTDDGQKIHMQTLGALTHIDYNIPRACSYEQMAGTAKQIGISAKEIEQLYRRMVFNVLAVNHDDHVKNFSFLMDRQGEWSLSPAYDLTFSYNPENRWLAEHQMTINGKSLNISEEDLLECGKHMDLAIGKCNNLIENVREAICKWPVYAEKAGVPEEDMTFIRKNFPCFT